MTRQDFGVFNISNGDLIESNDSREMAEEKASRHEDYMLCRVRFRVVKIYKGLPKSRTKVERLCGTHAEREKAKAQRDGLTSGMADSVRVKPEVVTNVEEGFDYAGN